MTGNEQHDAADGSGVQRHPPSHHGEDGLSDMQEVEDPPPTGRSRPESPPLSSASTTSGPIPRVRFSADLERVRPVNTPPFTTLNQPPSVGAFLGAAGSSTTKRLGIIDLAVDTTKVISEPSGVNQSVSHQSRSTIPQQQSPISPKTRGRGYSLRRSLFARSINEHFSVTRPSLDDVVELASVGHPNTELGPDCCPQPPMRTSHPASSEGAEKKVPEVAATGLSSHQESQRVPDKAKRDHASVALPNYASWKSRSTRIGVFGRVKSVFIKACKIVIRTSELPPSKEGRKIDLDAMRKSALIDERTGKEYIGNTIRSSRYTLWNFLPRQLFAQFSKLANLSVSTRASFPRYKLTPLQLFLDHINIAVNTR
jgi:phospholipid-translocating ATPase